MRAIVHASHAETSARMQWIIDETYKDRVIFVTDSPPFIFLSVSKTNKPFLSPYARIRSWTNFQVLNYFPKSWTIPSAELIPNTLMSLLEQCLSIVWKSWQCSQSHMTQGWIFLHQIIISPLLLFQAPHYLSLFYALFLIKKKGPKYGVNVLFGPWCTSTNF